MGEGTVKRKLEILKISIINLKKYLIYFFPGKWLSGCATEFNLDQNGLDLRQAKKHIKT